MAVHQPTRTVEATLTVLVTRDARGDLMDGVRERLAGLPAVSDVTVREVHGVRPGLNDLRVEVTVTAQVDEPPDAEDATLADRLTDGFGVAEATVRTRR
jgi:Co/Zn/Cd efflux system component